MQPPCPLPISMTVGSPLTLMHRAPHAHRRREVACSPNWLWLLRWWRLGGWWRAQDVVTAPARMSAQPNLPTSVRATLQFGPIYLATGGGHWLEQGQRCRCKVGWLPTRPTGDLRQIIKVTSAAIFYLRRPLAFGGRLEHVSDTDRASRGHPGSPYSS